MEQKLEFLSFVKRKRSEYIAPHRHECHELVYYVNGSGYTNIVGEIYGYSANTFTVISPECLHDEMHDEDTEVIFIGFKGFTGAIPEHGIYIDDTQHSILDYLKQIKREILEQKKNFRKKADLLLGELLIELERMNGRSIKSGKDFSHIQAFIEENFNQQLNLQNLAEMSGYSYHRFRHLFKQRTGFSPIGYMIDKRLKASAHLLKNSGLTILEISQDCGFSNESQFASMFKKCFGQTPSMYRKAPPDI